MKTIADALRHHPAWCFLAMMALAEAGMNATYGWIYFGAGSWFSMLMTLAFVGNEGVKCMSADGIGKSLAQRDRLRVALWSLMLVACMSISLTAHIGFIGLARGDMAASREAGADQSATARQQLGQARREREALGVQRPVATVEAAERLECTIRSAQYKDGIGPKCTSLREELGKAKRAVDLDAEIARLAAVRVETAKVGTADPQAQVLGWFWSADEEKIKLSLAIALAVAMELITGVGFLAVGNDRVQGWNTDVALAEGLLTHPGAAHVISFRNERAAVLRGLRGEDEVWRVYRQWAIDAGADPLQRGAFWRLYQAMAGGKAA